MTNTNLIIVRLVLNKKKNYQIVPNKHLIEETDEILICITCHFKTHYMTLVFAIITSILLSLYF